MDLRKTLLQEPVLPRWSEAEAMLAKVRAAIPDYEMRTPQQRLKWRSEIRNYMPVVFPEFGKREINEMLDKAGFE